MYCLASFFSSKRQTKKFLRYVCPNCYTQKVPTGIYMGGFTLGIYSGIKDEQVSTMDNAFEVQDIKNQNNMTILNGNNWHTNATTMYYL